MNRYVETEKKVQADFWFNFQLVNFFVGGALLICAFNNAIGVALVGGLVQILACLSSVPKIVQKFAERLKIVTFKTQVENLYVFTRHEDQPDDTVAATFYRTVDLLKEVGNKHEVRVHLILFRDVQIFTWFVDHSGKLVKKNTWRPTGSANETWDEYQDFIYNFEAQDRDERLRQLRKDAAGFDWVNENLFDQWRPDQ